MPKWIITFFSPGKFPIVNATVLSFFHLVMQIIIFSIAFYLSPFSKEIAYTDANYSMSITTTIFSALIETFMMVLLCNTMLGQNGLLIYSVSISFVAGFAHVPWGWFKTPAVMFGFCLLSTQFYIWKNNRGLYTAFFGTLWTHISYNLILIAIIFIVK